MVIRKPNLQAQYLGGAAAPPHHLTVGRCCVSALTIRMISERNSMTEGTSLVAESFGHPNRYRTSDDYPHATFPSAVFGRSSSSAPPFNGRALLRQRPD